MVLGRKKYDKTGLGSKIYYKLTEKEAREMQISKPSLEVMLGSEKNYNGYVAWGEILYPELYSTAHGNEERL